MSITWLARRSGGTRRHVTCQEAGMGSVEYAGGGATSAVNSASATTTVAVPLYTGTATGQPIVMAVASDASSGTWTTPAGWSVLVASVAVLTDFVGALYYKYSSGAESATVTVTGPSGHLVGASASLRCACATSLAASVSATSSVDTSTTSPTTGGTLSPVVGTNGLAVRVYVCSSRNAAASATLTAPSSPWTSRQNFINSSTSSAFCTGICICTQLGAISTASATASASGGSAWLVADAWFLDGRLPPIAAPPVPRMRSYNY
jgi:hypothetical protein